MPSLMFKLFKLVIILTFTVISIPIYSAQITYPDDSFKNKDTLTASDLNLKFNEIKTSVNSLAKLPEPTTYASVVRIQAAGLIYSENNSRPSSISIDGVEILVVGRSYGLVVIERATGDVVFSGSFDIFGSPVTDNPALTRELAKYGEKHIVIIATFDEPRNSRLKKALSKQMMRCGASSTFSNPAFRYRSAYALVGICDRGAGTGLEFYSGSVDSDPNAYIDTTVTITDGNFTAPFKIVPRVIRTKDSRTTGCPVLHAANVDLIAQKFTLSRTSQVVINADMIRNIAGRADLKLFVNGITPDGIVLNQKLLDKTLTYTSSLQWEDAHVNWVGVLVPGAYTVSLQSPTADVWGCRGEWGSIDTIIYE